MKTKDRILLESLKLFNRRGERNVSTNHIAAALDISPGNLYYHFRNKNEIVYQLFLQYEQQVRGFMAVPQERDITFQDKVNYLEDILNSMWDFRFLHQDLHHLLQDDDRLRIAYREFSSRTVADGRKILLSMAESGVLRANAEQIDALILNIWVMVVSWSSFLQSISIQNNEGGTLRKGMLKRAIYQIIALEEPFLCESVQALLPELKKHYLDGASTDPLALFPSMLDDAQLS